MIAPSLWSSRRPHVGWFDWIIHGDPRGGLIKVSCSEVYDPCPEIVRWMDDIAASRFPAKLKIDEEGKHVRFSIAPVPERPEWAELEIIRDFESGPKGPPPKLIFFTRVRPQQLVAQFLRRWTDWLSQDYVAKEWHQFHWTDDMDAAYRDRVADPATLDITVLEQFVSNERSRGE
ncbi:MAG: hypothetical protein M3505_08185 [Verrucomicrobiota bacterium]|nr:hypothetical protein [Verrucomicrobiota bacterium]